MSASIFMGVPPSMVIHNGRKLDGDFAWGKTDPKALPLALAILKAHLGNEAEARRWHTRFMWRTIRNWDAAKPWTLAGEEIDSVLADIKEADKAAAGIRSRVATEAAPVVSEGGIGPGGSAFSPIEQKG